MRTRLIQSSSYPVPSGPHSATATRGEHRSVLLHEAIDSLTLEPDDIVVDATLGGAGHARAIAARLDERGTFIGFDLDEDAIERARDALSDVRPKTILLNANFRDLREMLQKEGIERIDKALFDLGWSGFQLVAGRGFSFLSDDPLLMTYSNTEDGLTAAEIVNEWEEQSIADVLFGWGEERYARRIARGIVEERQKKPFATARELAETIRASVPSTYRTGRLHPATKTFQALRIAVNDELGALKAGLQSAWEMLEHDGKIAVITFHSIEDRIVKEMFVRWERLGEGKRITRSPIRPSREEIKENPRSRSAKLRVIQKQII